MSSSPTPFGHLTLGVDFSEHSRATLSWIHSHFAPTAKVDLVHAVELPRIPGFIRNAFPRFDEWVENLRRGAAERLTEIARDCGTVGAATVVDGSPTDCLIGRAAESESELIVVSAHGEHRGLGKLVGSTPERLLELSPVPVLVVRGEMRCSPTRILVAIDDSAMAEQVISVARRAAATVGASTALMTVVPTWLVESMRRHGGGDAVDELLRDQTIRARKWLGKVAEGNGLNSAEQIVEVGSPDLEILRAAQRMETDLIVMGTRGSGHRAPPLVGGCARYVLSNATCPVLFVVGRG